MSEPETFLATARRVIRAETEALAALEGSLNGDFARAVQMILDAPGRVIVAFAKRIAARPVCSPTAARADGVERTWGG